MKLKNLCLKFIVIMCAFLCVVLLSGCGADKADARRNVVMVKNTGMSTYGTGFAVGIPGKAVDTIVTAYSVVATSNGVSPKTAEVKINESEKNLTANVVFCDEGRNVAVLKLSEPTKTVKPIILDNSVNYDETVYVCGYEGTGNIMSEYESFNTTNIIRYGGNISTYDDINTIVVYKYSNEFNRAMVGGPALNKNGYVLGMCAYSLSSMNTYSQYILSSDELTRMFIAHDIKFMTADEVMYKNIIVLSVMAGFIVLIAIIAFALIIRNKKENNLIIKDRYIRITDGALKGGIYKFNSKLTIGKDSEKCDIVYPPGEPGIENVHCSIQLADETCYLVDHFSKSGTFLENGERISASYPHKIESEKIVFYIADNRFEFINKKESQV